MNDRCAALAPHRPSRLEAGPRPMAQRVLGAAGRPGCGCRSDRAGDPKMLPAPPDPRMSGPGEWPPHAALRDSERESEKEVAPAGPPAGASGRRSHRAGDPKMLPAPPDPRMSGPGDRSPRTPPCAVAKNEPWPEGCVPVAVEGVARGVGWPRGERRLQRGSTDRETRPAMKLAIVILVGVVRGGAHPTELFLEGGVGYWPTCPKMGRARIDRCAGARGAPPPRSPKRILGHTPSTRPAHLVAYRIRARCFGVLQEDPLWNKTTSPTPRSRPVWSESKQAQSSSNLQQHWLRCELRMDRRDIARSRLAGCPGSPWPPRRGWLYRTHGCGCPQTNSGLNWRAQHAKSAKRQVRWSPGGPNPPDSKQILGNAPSTRRAHLEAYRISVRYSGSCKRPWCVTKIRVQFALRPIWSRSPRMPSFPSWNAAGCPNCDLKAFQRDVRRSVSGGGHGVRSFRGSRDGAGGAGHVAAGGRKTNCELRPPGPQKVRVDDGRCRAAVPWGWPVMGQRRRRADAGGIGRRRRPVVRRGKPPTHPTPVVSVTESASMCLSVSFR